MVLEGEALYLLQKEDLSDVVAINAAAGIWSWSPPITGISPSIDPIRPSRCPIFVARDFSSLYDPIKGDGRRGIFL